MLNIEKYKKELKEDYLSGKTLSETVVTVMKMHDIKYSETILDWLLEEYKEPILDEEERKYLSNIVKPFKDKIEYIVKGYIAQGGKKIYEVILFKGIDSNFDASLPGFKVGAMYKGMAVGTRYTLEELDL